MIFVMELRINS